MPTHYEGSLVERQALDVYIKLMRASETVAARLKRHLAANKITLSQLGVLESLYHLGPMFQSDLSAKLLKSSGNLTTVVDNLEKRGLVVRERPPEDRRYVQVSLTPKGRSLIAPLFPEHVGEIVGTMSALTLEEQAQLARLCKKLGLGNAPG